MNDMELAEGIGGLIFDAIKHGDVKHQAWLHDKSHELAPKIIAALRRGPEPVPEGFVQTVPDPLGRTICTAEAMGQLAERPPSGEMVMVPREPTKEMIEAGKDERMECFKTEGRETNPISVGEALTRIYRAMLSAAEAEGRKT